MKVSVCCLLILMLSACSDSDTQGRDLAAEQLSEHKHDQLNHYLDNNYCSCDCGMLISECLRDDPTCEVSKEMARNAINFVENGPSSPAVSYDAEEVYQSDVPTEVERPYMETSGTGSVTSGRVNGQDCTYISVGGTTMKSCD